LIQVSNKRENNLLTNVVSLLGKWEIVWR